MKYRMKFLGVFYFVRLVGLVGLVGLVVVVLVVRGGYMLNMAHMLGMVGRPRVFLGLVI